MAMVFDLNIAMISVLNMAIIGHSNNWWYYSRANVHVCNNKAHFQVYKEVDEAREVLMGNHNTATVLGMGSVEIQFTSRRNVTLVNVLYIPNIRKNLFSANSLCKSGLKIVHGSNKLISSKNDVFVGKGHSCDGMFKLSINNMMNLFTYIVDRSLFYWHCNIPTFNHKA